MTGGKRRKSQKDQGGHDAETDRGAGVLPANKKTPFHFRDLWYTIELCYQRSKVVSVDFDWRKPLF